MNENQDEWETKMPAEFRNELNSIRSSVPPGESQMRFLLAAEEVERTVNAMNRLSRLSVALAVLGCIAVVAGAVWLIALSQASILFASMVAAFLISTIGFMFVFVRARRDLKIAGPILLDCGQMTMRAPILLCLMSAASFTMVLATSVDFHKVPWYYWIAGGAILLPTTSYFIAISRGHLQIRTNGIWHYVGFLPWHEIESWGWTGGSELVLIIEKSGRSLLSKRGALTIPSGLKDQFEELLQQNCVCDSHRQ